MVRVCGHCGGSMAGKSSRAKWCGDVCRRSAFSVRHGGGDAGSVPVVPSLPEGGSTVELARAELESAGRSGSYLSAAALQAAKRLDESTVMNGYAGLLKEFRATMAAALDGAKRAADPLVVLQDELEARRAGRRAG